MNNNMIINRTTYNTNANYPQYINVSKAEPRYKNQEATKMIKCFGCTNNVQASGRSYNQKERTTTIGCIQAGSHI